jgi:hypothetical protein
VFSQIDDKSIFGCEIHRVLCHKSTANIITETFPAVMFYGDIKLKNYIKEELRKTFLAGKNAKP